MNTAYRRFGSMWARPIAAGALIALAAVLSLAQGVNPFAGGSAHTPEGPPSGALVTAAVVMIIAALVAGVPIAMAAMRALLVGSISIDLLVSVAAIGAIVIGEYWEAAAVTFLFAIGHALEARTLDKTRSALTELIAVVPDVAIVLRDGHQVEIPASEVQVGETVLVKNGAKIAVDGAVIDGTGAVDEASITGESVPVEKMAGDRVFAGTVSAGGFLHIQATGVGADTTLARIIHRVEEAQDAKAAAQTFMEKFATWYTPGIMVLALVAGLVTGDTVLALTLLVIGCPGALVISIPVAIVAGVGRGARDGILIKGGEYLEASARISVVALDKTGTLTEGSPQLTDVTVLNPALHRRDVLRWAARAEAASEHPLARPIIDAAQAEGLDVRSAGAVVDPVPGKGIVALVDDRRVAVGNLALLADEQIPQTHTIIAEWDRLASLGRTPMVIALDGVVIGMIAVADRLRTDAATMVEELHRAGVTKVIMLTGDTERVARSVAETIGLDEVHAGLLPEDKLGYVQKLQSDGHSVAMVGDGVNDAPALAAADIGVAMGVAGTGVAIETADIALMTDDLRAIPRAMGLARRTIRIMHQNIAVALVTVLMLLAGVFAGGVTMAVGMLVHQGSVLLVIVNAMRLMRRQSDRPAGASADRRRSPSRSRPRSPSGIAA